MDEVQDPGQDHTSNRGDGDGAQPVGWRDAKETAQVSANQSADQAHDQVADYAETAALGQHPCDPTSDDPGNDPNYDRHRVTSFSNSISNALVEHTGTQSRGHKPSRLPKRLPVANAPGPARRSYTLLTVWERRLVCFGTLALLKLA
jgi:hypothetical protein